MRLKENLLLTDPACDDTIVLLSLAPIDGSTVKPFIAGQFVRIAIPSKPDLNPAYFAIASSPDEEQSYQFVVKGKGGVSEQLISLVTDAELEVEGPMGKGFSLSEFKGFDVILMGVGTGIAPLRSAWNYILNHRDQYGAVSIYAGFLTPLHSLLTDEMQSLADHNIKVTVSLATGDANWNGSIGFVQDALLLDAPSSASGIACLAGMSSMVDACTQSLHQLGFDDDHILLNY
ncbi:MAG: hydrogenase [Mariprofundaceae bacterium]